MTSSLVDRAREIISTNIYINIASVSDDGLPWNTPLFARYDTSINFYWTSWTQAQHSLNIKYNNEVFITVYDSTRKRGDNNQRCLYMRGTASEVSNGSLVTPLLELIYGDEAKTMSSDDYLGDAIKRIYQFTPQALWLNSLSERQVTHETIKMRVEVPMTDLIMSLKEA